MMLDVIMAVMLRLMVKAFILFIALIMVLDVIEPNFSYGDPPEPTNKQGSIASRTKTNYGSTTSRTINK